jgi:hypothetical protein
VQNFGALGKAIFCRVPHSVKVALPSAEHRQRQALGKVATRQNEAGPARRPPAVRFCRVPAVRPSANFSFYFFKTYFAECQAHTLGKKIIF